MVVRGEAICSLSSRNNIGPILSGPQALLGFRPFSNFSTPGTVTLIGGIMGTEGKGDVMFTEVTDVRVKTD